MQIALIQTLKTIEYEWHLTNRTIIDKYEWYQSSCNTLIKVWQVMAMASPFAIINRYQSFAALTQRVARHGIQMDCSFGFRSEYGRDDTNCLFGKCHLIYFMPRQHAKDGLLQ